jgi:hypothetical protein
MIGLLALIPAAILIYLAGKDVLPETWRNIKEKMRG